MSQTEAHPWLKEKVYEPARQRTVQLVRQAVDSLVKQAMRVSLASVIDESTKIDPDGRGVSKGGILGNPDAKAYYDCHRSWKGPKRGKSTGSGCQNAAIAQRPIDPNRDTARVRNRLTRKGKDELADRVLELEQGFAMQEEQWLRLMTNCSSGGCVQRRRSDRSRRCGVPWTPRMHRFEDSRRS